MNKKSGLFSFLANIDLIFTGIIMVILVLLTFIGVIMRRFFNDPIMWQEEVQVWCFLWVIFLAAGAVFRTIGHVSIEILVDVLPRKLARIIEILGYLVVMVILIYTMFRGFELVQKLYDIERTTSILRVPYGILYASLPVGCILMMINYTIAIIRSQFIDYKKLSIDTKEGDL